MAMSVECSECLTERDHGKRDDFEVNLGYDECVLCREPACDSHGRNYDTNVVSGWAHETCKEDWRNFVED
jgi:hypothetical protein